MGRKGIMKVDLEGKVALVTGAARGIGQSIADAFVQNGAFVVYTDIDTAEVKHAAGRFEATIDLKMDVTDEEEVQAVVKTVVETYGHLDILVNNAGVNTIKHRVTIDAFPKAEWDRILNVDLNGLFLVSQAVAQVMKRQQGGRIINISSIAGLVPIRLQAAFVAAKSAVVNLTKVMAVELATDGILVNGIAPGSTLTDATKKLFYGKDGTFSDSVQQLLAHIPLGRPAEVHEIAQAALFFSDPENTYTTGQVLAVDGGWTSGYIRDF